MRESEAPERQMKRSLTAFDLTCLGIGAIIGSGIFALAGTAAAGQPAEAAASFWHTPVLNYIQSMFTGGEVVMGRPGAGPGVILSFAIAAIACGFAALCYAELAAMIPVSGSAYTYSYATLGEIVAWIIGWDLILEYAVGNIAVAVAWSGYFTSLLSGFGIEFPMWLTHGYRTALLSSNPEVHGLLQTAPRVFGIPILLNVPAALVVLAITWLLYIGVRESSRANNAMVVVKLLVLTLFVVLGAMHIDPTNY